MTSRKTILNNKNILLGVSGGISAYKTIDLASKLAAAGARISTVMTEAACQLVCPKSFEAICCSTVYTNLWAGHAPNLEKPGHVKLADWAEIVVIAPATANIIGKIANGICDDLLTTTLCACWPLIESGAALLAPAMNNNMWNNPAVQNNIKTLKKMGFNLIGPVRGRLVCGRQAVGRMAEPHDILKAIEKISSKIKRKP